MMEKIKQYKILESLGSGGMGMVYKAFDTVLEREVAIKVMHKNLLNDPNNDKRFLQEARAAAKFVHPNVVTIHEIGKADCGRYIVMEYVNGIPLTEFLRRNKVLSIDKALKFQSQLLSGLSSAHELGILHRDIKGENILVNKQEQIKILDFGIAKFANQIGMTVAGDILGTAEYMAPEQMMGEELDVRCDVYAAGIVFYQMLTNQLPFSGDSPVTLLYKRLNEDPSPPSFFNREVNSELDKIVLKAINREREKRWETAGKFAEAVDQILNGKSKSTSQNKSEEGFVDELIEEELWGTEETEQLNQVFVGRRQEVQMLTKITAQVLKGKGQTAVIRGEAGVGKTTLANRFRNYLEKQDAWVLYGACLYQDGMDAYLPYIDALRGFFSNESFNLPHEERQKIKDVVRERVPLLLEFTERFSTSFGQKSNELLEEDDGNQFNLFEGIHVLVSLLSTIKPVVLVIDDLQWADEASLRLFHYLGRHITNNKILQLGISRTDRYDLQQNGKPSMVVDVLSRMRQEGVSKELNLDRLTREENDRLIDESLSKTLFSDEFYQKLYEETKGNPFFVLETIKMLQENDSIYLKEGIWYDKHDLKKLVVPNRVEDVFVRRLSALNEEERELLQVAAVMGNKFDVTILSKIIDIPRLKLLKSLQRTERDLQVLSSTEDGFQFEHPMLQELLYDEIPTALRREYHLLIADEIQQMQGGNLGALVGDVAEHYRQGGNHRKAIPLLYQAGIRAFRLSAYNESSFFLENLLQSVEHSKEELPESIEIGDVYLKLAICYEEVGRWQESIEFYNILLDLSKQVKDPNGQNDALLRLGRVYVKLGDWDEALKHYEHSLDLVTQYNIPGGLSRIYNNLGIIHFQKGNYDEALNYFDQSLENTEHEDGKYDEANALMNMAIIFNIRGDYSIALDSYQRALEIYQEKQNPQSEAQVYHNIGMTYSDMHDWKKAIEAYNKCFELADSIEDKGLIALTNLNVGKVYLRQDDHNSAKKFADKAMKFFKRASDVLSVAEIYYIYGLIYTKEKNFEKAKKFLLESIRINQEKEYQEGLAEAYEAYAEVLFVSNEDSDANEYYVKALEIYRKLKLTEKIESIEKQIEKMKESLDYETQEARAYAE